MDKFLENQVECLDSSGWAYIEKETEWLIASSTLLTNHFSLMSTGSVHNN